MLKKLKLVLYTLIFNWCKKYTIKNINIINFKKNIIELCLSNK